MTTQTSWTLSKAGPPALRDRRCRPLQRGCQREQSAPPGTETTLLAGGVLSHVLLDCLSKRLQWLRCQPRLTSSWQKTLTWRGCGHCCLPQAHHGHGLRCCHQQPRRALATPSTR